MRSNTMTATQVQMAMDARDKNIALDPRIWSRELGEVYKNALHAAMLMHNNDIDTLIFDELTTNHSHLTVRRDCGSLSPITVLDFSTWRHYGQGCETRRVKPVLGGADLILTIVPRQDEEERIKEALLEGSSHILTQEELERAIKALQDECV